MAANEVGLGRAWKEACNFLLLLLLQIQDYLFGVFDVVEGHQETRQKLWRMVRCGCEVV